MREFSDATCTPAPEVATDGDETATAAAEGWCGGRAASSRAVVAAAAASRTNELRIPILLIFLNPFDVSEK